MSDQLTDDEFFHPYPAPNWSLVLNSGDIARARRRGEQVPDLPPNWPPPGWEEGDFPADYSAEASLQWLDFEDWVLRLNERNHEFAYPAVVRDAYRLVDHFAQLGRQNPPPEPEYVESTHAARLKLRTVRAWLGEPQKPGGNGELKLSDGDGLQPFQTNTVARGLVVPARRERTAGYLGLIVDAEHRTVRRKGYRVTVHLSTRPRLWHIFDCLFRAGENGATKAMILNGYEGESNGSALRNQIRRLRDALLPLDVTIPAQEWRLVASHDALHGSDDA